MIQFLQMHHYFQGQTSNGSFSISNDKMKFLKLMITMCSRCVTGHFINFAICDFYNDNSFSQLCSLVFTTIQNQSQAQINEYPKLKKTQHKFLEDFFKRNMELMFVHFDPKLISSCIEKVLVPGYELDIAEIKQSCLVTLDCFNDFVFNHIRKPSQKQ